MSSVSTNSRNKLNDSFHSQMKESFNSRNQSAKSKSSGKRKTQTKQKSG